MGCPETFDIDEYSTLSLFAQLWNLEMEVDRMKGIYAYLAKFGTGSSLLSRTCAVACNIVVKILSASVTLNWSSYISRIELMKSQMLHHYYKMSTLVPEQYVARDIKAIP